ncbi:MAG: hypothetical protein QM740_07035 [Acidovorax sp.]
MTTRRARKAKPMASIASKTTELALATPQVVAHRVARMAIAGPSPSKRDRREFKLMVNEKGAAFFESWNAMAMEAVRANQAITLAFFRSMWSPAFWFKPSASPVAKQLQSAAFGVVDKGLAPVHRKAVANAKRLARTKLR